MSRHGTSPINSALLVRTLFLIIPLCLLFTAVTADTREQNEMKPEEVMEAEERLSNLGYWTGPVDKRFDGATRQSLIAFQKIEGRKRTGKLTVDELIALRAARTPQPREAGPAHVEVDLYRQVLFMVDDAGAVSKILPISSGSGEMFTSEG
ncbi:MAG TPA: peptidoglycan-binding domain-containing protein, partial [Blastocatellia bacterium]